MSGKKNDTSGGGKSGGSGVGGWSVTYSASLNTVLVQTGQCSVLICVKPPSPSVPARVMASTSRCRPSRRFGWWSARQRTAFRRWSESRIERPACCTGLTIPRGSPSTGITSAGISVWAAKWLRKLTGGVVRVASSMRTSFFAVRAFIRGGIRSDANRMIDGLDETCWFNHYK
jgi:hypothetical protein